MNAAILHRLLLITTIVCLAALPRPAAADDIDIFLGRSGGSADAPNVMILIDNSANWSRNSQQWANNLNQGQAEVAALQQVLTYLAGQGTPINIGLSMLTSNSGGNGTGGGYIRFGARDVTQAANLNAFNNILTHLYNYTNGGGQQNEQCCGMSHKDETAAFYELYKYFSGLTPYSGTPNSVTVWDDYYGNIGGGLLGSAGLTTYAQGLASGWGLSSGSGSWQYVSPLSSTKPCAASYIIYIANNSNGQIGSTENVYEPRVVPALSALPVQSGSTDTWLDEWTNFLYTSGVVVPQGNNNGSIVTYVLDAYNAQQDVGYSGSLQSAAKRGGGRYYQVGSQAAVYNALLNIILEIQAVNSTFASASLPVNATNRTQDRNEVFVPMFRPDGGAQPRWMGNLKQYQLINLGGSIQLGDASGAPAVNLLTGTPAVCAASIWSTDSTDLASYPNGYFNYNPSVNAAGYWNITAESGIAKGSCATSSLNPWSDLPDGPVVEKGGVAEVIRKGNNPPSTNTSPTWSPGARTILTLSGVGGSAVVPFNTNSTGLPASLVNWVLGQDVQDENGNSRLTESRPSLHGDPIHSRPLPVDYGNGNIVVYYGSNDGMLRAADAATGRELWGFVAPEFYTPAPAIYPGATPTGLERLMWSGMNDAEGDQISPLVKFYGIPAGLTPTPVPKDYFFDGSIGLYETSGSSPGKVWIYPTMRRGGRMIYAFDVTTPGSPALLWKFGCPSQTNNTGCVPGSATNVTSIGQTWSLPNVAASVLGYSGPVIVMGGGYDTCEDANTPTPSCDSPRGAGVYVIDAQTGSQLAFFPTTRSVAADVSLISAANSGVVDHAYAADTGGNIYRIDFAASPSSWKMSRIGYTNGAGRKFLFGPALLAGPNNTIYLGIGSGDREHPLQAQYPYSTVLNRFYVLRDDLTATGAVNMDDTSAMYDFTSQTTCSIQGVLPTSAYKGWFMNLNQYGQGEQTVTSALIAAGMVSFSTNRPIPPAQGSCTNALGQANGYWVNLFNASGGIGVSGASCGGTRAVPFIGGGLPPSPVLAAVPVGQQVVEVAIGAANLGGGSSCGICAQQITPAIVPKRKIVFWKSSGEN